MSRPEDIAPPEVFYNDVESKKYSSSSRVQHIQAAMTLRALELLNLPKNSFVLDIGCGSSLSGEILTEEGHIWCGMDISPDMLAVGLTRESEGDLILQDIGQGIPFRAGTLDAAISISAIQWLCNADTSYNDPKLRLKRFFNTLFAALKKGGKFVAQFYPKNNEQIEQIQNAGRVAGFSGGLVIDNFESKKNKKYYLVLSSGVSEHESQVNLDGVTMSADLLKKNERKRKELESRKDYIMRKKDLMKKRGKKVAKDSKFTGRKRRPRF